MCGNIAQTMDKNQYNYDVINQLLPHIFRKHFVTSFHRNQVTDNTERHGRSKGS